MAEWVKATSRDSILAALQSDSFETAVDALGAVSAVLDTVGSTAGFLANFLLATDPVALVLSGTVNILQTAVADLLNTDIYAFPMLPTQPSALLRPYTIQSALNDMVQGLGDRGDGSRPNAGGGGSENSAFAATMLMVGADNWTDFTRLLRLLGDVIDGTEINKWSKLADIRVKYDEFELVPRSERAGQGTPWDWSRTNWLGIVGLTSQVDDLLKYLEKIARVTYGLAAAISQATSILAKRLAFIQNLIAEVVNILDFFAKLALLISELWVVSVASETGGVTGMANALISATNQPPFKLTAGVLFASFVPNPTASFTALSNLVGLQLDAFEQIVVNNERDLQVALDRQN